MRFTVLSLSSVFLASPALADHVGPSGVGGGSINVISPDTRLVYRDGSEATEGVVRGAGAHLAEGGLAHFLVNWAHDPGDWAAPLRTWIPPGCDAMVRATFS